VAALPQTRLASATATTTVATTGNEGYGLRSMVKRCCTQLVQIEMAPGGGAARQQQQLVDSLNVSVATGILLHHMLTAAQGRQQ
jgi:21S rRNA (GM2251-2'-O)-methyltransferase